MMLRIQRGTDTEGISYQEYQCRTGPGTTVLDALLQVRDEQDDSLAFRYSCRGAVCGACAMMINGRPRLACRTQVEMLGQEKLPPLSALPASDTFEAGSEILLQPLPRLPLIRDLAVDMEPFFAHYRAVRPTMAAKGSEAMSQDVVAELEKYAACVLCACCDSACPVAAEREYLGPAALAKGWRFAADPRDARGEARLRELDIPSGWSACRFHRNCSRVCPKDVPPDKAIGAARGRLRTMKEGRT